VHGRTRRQGFAGTVDTQAIRNIVGAATIPIVGNGDVTGLASYSNMKSTGVTAVMIGRGMLQYPWIFKAIREGKEPSTYFSLSEIYNLILKLYSNMLNHAKEDKKREHYFNVIKRHSASFFKGAKDSAELRRRIFSAENEEEFLKYLQDYVTSEE
jgi:tRNA-dihydrouridine synthase